MSSSAPVTGPSSGAAVPAESVESNRRPAENHPPRNFAGASALAKTLGKPVEQQAARETVSNTGTNWQTAVNSVGADLNHWTKNLG